VKEDRLAIIGSFPPPFGGVANHVARLIPLLDSANVCFRVYNAVSTSECPPNVVSVSRERNTWLPRFLFFCEEKAVFLLSDRLLVWLLAAIVLRIRGRKVGVRLRNSVVTDAIQRGGLAAMLMGWALRRMALVVCVSKELLDAVKLLGVATNRIVHAPGFLPPSATCANNANVSQRVMDYCQSGEPLIVANGRIKEYEGHDLYGLDLIVQLAGRLLKDFPNLRVVVCFWDFAGEDQSRLDELLKMADKLGALDCIMFNTESGVFIPVLRMGTVFVRPTSTDGDANSIREALALGVPAVASDVVTRPVGCIEFLNRDLDDFECKVRRTLADRALVDGERVLNIDEGTMRSVDSYIRALTILAA
jgi:glycosyltransferase involved in cell wall biosynthesis